MKFYYPNSWYWAVTGDSTRVYFSAIGDYISTTDSTFVAWKADGTAPTAIDTEASLGLVLANAAAPRPVNVNVLAQYQAALANGVNVAIFKVLFNHENRIRALEGKAPITVQQALTGFAALM